MRPQQAMGAAWQFGELDVLDHLGLSSRGGIWRQNAIGIAVDNQRRHVVAENVLAEVFDPRVNALQCSYCRSLNCDVPVGLDHTFADELSRSDIVVIEVMQEIEKEGWPVRLNRGSLFKRRCTFRRN